VSKRKTKPVKHHRTVSDVWLNRAFVAILLVLALVYFAPLLSGRKMMYGSDWLLSGYASRRWLADSIRLYGEGPLWNPNFFSGLPARNPYTLLTLLYLILPVHMGWSYLFVLAMFLAGLGTYLYLKELKLSLSVSLLGGIAYMGCGSLLSMTQPGHDGKILAASLFPFVLLFLHKAVTRGKLIYFLFAGGMGGICAVHAHFQLTYYAAVVCMAYLLCHLIWQRTRGTLAGSLRLVGYSILGLVCAGGLALIKFLPIFGSLGWGSRGGIERGYEFATSWSLPPMELLDLLTPHFSGLLSNYWGENYFKLDTQYLGILPLLLALVGVVFKYRERPVKFFLGLGLVATLFSLGKYTPFYRIPYYLLPHVSKFRGPSMAFYLTAFSVVVLAAFGLQALLENLRSRKKLTVSLLVVFTGVLLFTLICTGARNSVLGALSSHLEPTLRRDYGPQLTQQKIHNLYQNYPDFLKGLGRSLLLIGIGSVLIFLLTMKKWKLGSLVMFCFAALLIFDQWSIQRKFLRADAHPDTYFAADNVVEFLKETDKGLFRVFPLIYEHAKDGYLVLHGLQSVGGYVSNPYHRYQELIGAGKSVMFTPANLVKYRNFIHILNVKYLISVWVPENLSEQDEKTRQMVQDFKLNFAQQWGISWEDAHEGLDLVFTTGRGYAVYRNNSVLPRAWLVPQYRVLDKDKILDHMKDPTFNPRATVILEEEPGIPLQQTTQLVGDVEITGYGPNRIVCQVALESPGLLVLSENWHPDWKAYADGEETRVLRADYILRAVSLDKGRHEVTFVLKSGYSRLGIWTGLLFSLFFAGVIVYWVLRRERWKGKR